MNLGNLILDIQKYIFSYLHTLDLLQCQQVSRDFFHNLPNDYIQKLSSPVKYILPLQHDYVLYWVLKYLQKQENEFHQIAESDIYQAQYNIFPYQRGILLDYTLILLEEKFKSFGYTSRKCLQLGIIKATQIIIYHKFYYYEGGLPYCRYFQRNDWDLIDREKMFFLQNYSYDRMKILLPDFFSD